MAACPSSAGSIRRRGWFHPPGWSCHGAAFGSMAKQNSPSPGAAPPASPPCDRGGRRRPWSSRSRPAAPRVCRCHGDQVATEEQPRPRSVQHQRHQPKAVHPVDPALCHARQAWRSLQQVAGTPRRANTLPRGLDEGLASPAYRPPAKPAAHAGSTNPSGDIHLRIGHSMAGAAGLAQLPRGDRQAAMHTRRTSLSLKACVRHEKVPASGCLAAWFIQWPPSP